MSVFRGSLKIPIKIFRYPDILIQKNENVNIAKCAELREETRDAKAIKYGYLIWELQSIIYCKRSPFSSWNLSDIRDRRQTLMFKASPKVHYQLKQESCR